MDDTLHGKRDKGGYWKPFIAITYPNVFVWPVQPMAILKWIPGYLLPWNALYAVRSNPIFLFGNQNLENLFWTFVSGVPIWTAYEAMTLWLFANGHIPMVTWASNPVWFVALLLVIQLWREFHFYMVHRLIHWPPLYRWVHKLHHNNTNPAPFSGLSMHPVEHLVYFSAVALHWIVPSHPIHAIYNLVHLGLAPAGGHTGYERIIVGDKVAFDSHCYMHYLHHRYFECNYADGTLPARPLVRQFP